MMFFWIVDCDITTVPLKERDGSNTLGKFSLTPNPYPLDRHRQNLGARSYWLTVLN
jgi:hypothetical protein